MELCLKVQWQTCDVVGYPAISSVTALAQATVPLMEQADIVLWQTCPKVPGRHLLCGIILVWLTLPLPYVAIKIIKIVRGNVRNAIKMEKVSFCSPNTDQMQQTQKKHLSRWSETARALLKQLFLSHLALAARFRDYWETLVQNQCGGKLDKSQLRDII